MEIPDENSITTLLRTGHRPVAVTAVKDIASRRQTRTPDEYVHFPRRKWMTFAVLAFTVLVLRPPCLAAAPAAPTTVMVTSYGAYSDGTHATQTTAAFKNAFSANPNAEIIVPPGFYAMDNSSGPLIVTNFNGELRFQGQAQLVFNTPNQGGLWFSGGTGAQIYRLRATYSQPPTVRVNNQEALKFLNTTDSLVSDVNITYSPASGIMFFQCVRPRLVNAVVQQSLADGTQFANCQDPQVLNFTADHPGDDGLSFLNYASSANNTGGVANNITVTASGARGISVLGQSNVVVSGFSIKGTASSGLLCGADPVYNTRASADVRIGHGIVENAGTVGPGTGNRYGIEFSLQDSCAFFDIDVRGSAGRGVGGMAPSGRIMLNDIRVSANLSGEAFNFYQTALVEVSGATAANAPDVGFYFNQCNTVVANYLTTINVSQANALARAIWFDSDQFVSGSNFTIADSQAAATGYVVGSGQSATVVNVNGVIRGITPILANGTLSIQNTNPNLIFLK